MESPADGAEAEIWWRGRGGIGVLLRGAFHVQPSRDKYNECAREDQERQVHIEQERRDVEKDGGRDSGREALDNGIGIYE